jgi:hypothetical protein
LIQDDDDLRATIRRAYEIFPEMEWDGRIATVCPCCVSESVALALASTPRELIDVDLMSEYLSSAHAFGEGSAEAEFRHFLPRIFELLAAGEEVSMSGNECALMRLSNPAGRGGSWREIWSPREIEAIEGFFVAYWLDVLGAPAPIFQRRRTNEWLFEGMRAEETLCMVANAGGSVENLLLLWDINRNQRADLHLAAFVSNATPRAWREYGRNLEDRRLGDPHWDFQPDSERIVVDWLLAPRQCRRLMDAFMAAGRDSPEAEILMETNDELERVLIAMGAGAAV